METHLRVVAGVDSVSLIGKVQQAAAAVLEFIEGEPGWSGLGDPFYRLIVALNEIERGQTVDWLTPKRKANPGVSPSAELLRGRVVSIMNILNRRGGMKMDDAAAHVLRQLGPKAAARLAGKTQVEVWTIREWRRMPLDRDSPTREGFRWQEKITKALPPALSKTDARAFADASLSAIAKHFDDEAA